MEASVQFHILGTASHAKLFRHLTPVGLVCIVSVIGFIPLAIPELLAPTVKGSRWAGFIVLALFPVLFVAAYLSMIVSKGRCAIKGGRVVFGRWLKQSLDLNNIHSGDRAAQQAQRHHRFAGRAGLLDGTGGTPPAAR